MRDVFAGSIITMAPIPNIPQPSLFTLAPSHSAGRQSLKGFQFQTAYIAYVLAGFAAGKEDFISCRIEAVEDLDALLRGQDTWIERYYQVKSKQEGSGRWTLNLLEREGVLANFFSQFRRFRLQRGQNDRTIELVVAVDGELDGDLVRLRDEGPKAANVRNRLFAILCAAQVISRNRLFEPLASTMRDCFHESAPILTAQTAPISPEFDRILTHLRAERDDLPAETLREVIIDAVGEVASSLDDFMASLRFESRASSSLLNAATFGRLVEAGDLSPVEASAAVDSLKHSIQAESALPTPTAIDHSVLRGWLGVVQRVRVQAKPASDIGSVTRQELLNEVSNTLGTDPFVVLYGLSKIGKSQFVASLIDHNSREENYFWYTFAGDRDDLNRLIQQLTVWIGVRTGKWQLLDDLRGAWIHPQQAFARLGQAAIIGSYIVLDDCHKAADSLVFQLLRKLTSQDWKDCCLILISERKIPAASGLGAKEIPAGGLTPKESILFMAKLGVSVADSIAQLAMLSVQVGGHPVMLRATAKELSPKPSPAEVTALSQRIPSIESFQPFLSDLSNRIFFDLLKTPDQRAWLTRIAAVAFAVTRDLALALAKLKPPLQVLALDWDYLRSLLLDETRVDHYSVPALLQQVATASTSPAERKLIQVTAARHIFRAAIASRVADFWDFQHAIFALLGAESYDEAAMRFVHALPALMELKSFAVLELLFLAMNGEQIHAKITDPTARWVMLQFEVQLRIQDEGGPNWLVIRKLIWRMHRALARPSDAHAIFRRAMLHLAIASVKIRELRDSKITTKVSRHRLFAALDSALRFALILGDSKFIASLLHFYEDLYPFIARPNVEILKNALLQLPAEEPLPLSFQALDGIYTTYVSYEHHSDAAMQILERHSEQYRLASRSEAHFACELAVAIILHDGRANYPEARRRLEAVVSPAAGFQVTPRSRDRAHFSIGDTYFAEGNYGKSAVYYEMVLHADFGASGLHQITCERLCDSLIHLNKHTEAAQVVLMDMRAHRAALSPEQKGRMYARLAYAFAEGGALKKAAISCLGLCRVATHSASDTLDLLGAIVTEWVLGHFKYSDPGIPGFSTDKIQDSNLLSNVLPPEEIKVAPGGRLT